MKFIIRNQADISNKFIRFAKWKLNKLNRKFDLVIYSEIFVQKESQSPLVYNATVKLGVPGPDIIVSARSQNLQELWSKIFQKMQRQLRRYSDLKSKSVQTASSSNF